MIGETSPLHSPSGSERKRLITTVTRSTLNNHGVVMRQDIVALPHLGEPTV